MSDVDAFVSDWLDSIEGNLLRDPASGHEYYAAYSDAIGPGPFDWELFFDSVALSYFGYEEYAVGGLRVFLDDQRPNGFVGRHVVNDEDDGTDVWRAFETEEHCKPFLFQVALVVSKLRGDASWLGTDDFRRLRRYLDHWLCAWDEDGNGLSEWNGAPHSGADTQLQRVGTWGERRCEGADLNSYLYRECRAGQTLAEAAGRPEDAAHFRDRAAEKASAVREYLWDDDEGFFYDRDVETGTRIEVKTGAAFVPLWAGLATDRQAERLVEEHLRNPEEFWTPCPVPSYSRTEEAYTQHYRPGPHADPVYGLSDGHANWCGGAWPHWNYMIVHGLARYGFADVAADVAERYREAVVSSAEPHEWYDAETGAGRGAHPLYAGPTVLAALLPAELDRGLDPTAIGPVAEGIDAAGLRSAYGPGS